MLEVSIDLMVTGMTWLGGMIHKNTYDSFMASGVKEPGDPNSCRKFLKHPMQTVA